MGASSSPSHAAPSHVTLALSQNIWLTDGMEALPVHEEALRHLRMLRRAGFVALPEAAHASSRSMDAERAGKAAALAAVAAQIAQCRKCRLCDGRTNTVPGEGNPDADLVFIGEGPGEQEDRRGRPFVGPAGELLDKMIVAMHFRREDVFIGNIVKCRPPGNRDPEPDEVAACSDYLARQLDIIRPRIIVTLGRPATQALLDSTEPLARLRGKWQEYKGIPVMPTYHPAYLLRKPEEKRKTWQDLQMVMAEYERRVGPLPGRNG